MTTETEHVEHDVFKTITTERPERTFDTVVVPAVYLTRTVNTIGDWTAPRQTASFVPSVPSPGAMYERSPPIVYQGKEIPRTFRSTFRPAAASTDDAAEYRKNVKSGKWKEFKNGE